MTTGAGNASTKIGSDGDMDARTIFERPPVRFKRCKHGAMLFFSNDHYVGRSLDLYGEFCEGEYEVFAQILRSGMTVVDVEANIGAHTIGFAELVGSLGRVFAFEPRRARYHMLCGNLALNGLSHVAAFQAALASTAGAMVVPAIADVDATAAGSEADLQPQSDEQVPSATLDSFDLNQCHFLKVDVQGRELDVLKGASETLAKHHPLLYVANGQRANSAALIGWLLERDYDLYWHLPPLFNPQNYFKGIINVFAGIVSVNMLAIPVSLNATIHSFRKITSADDHWAD
jgi:FkbM family methyltransferase